VGPPPEDDAVKQGTGDAENEQMGVNRAGEPHGRDDALAECDRLLADAARVMQDARVVSQRLRDDTLAEVEAQARSLIAEAEKARDAIIGDARRIRDEVLAEADADAERRHTDAESAHLAAVADADARARELREEAEGHARALRDEAEAHAREVRDLAVAAATAEAEREARRHEAEAAAARRAREDAFRAELEQKQAAVLEVSVAKAERLLAEAAAAAEEHRAQAEQEAARTLIEARAESERLNAAALAEGREEVARLLAETLAQGRAEVDRMLAAAGDERARVLEDAQREVRELVRQAEADSRLVRAEATRWFAERARDVAAIALPGQVAPTEARPEARPEPRPPDPTVAGRSRARRIAGEIMLLIAVPMFAAFFLKSYVAQAFYIPSASMEPKLEEGDRVIVSKLAYRLQSPKRGDVVVFHPPLPAPQDHASLPLRALHGILAAIGIRQPGDDTFIKRVVGLPGETVEGRTGRVFLNGRPLDEPYLKPDVVTSDFAPVHLGGDQLFLMGDNRPNSSDSRIFGPVDRRRVVGEATTRAWPPPRAGFL
jgi:signal peptidase I